MERRKGYALEKRVFTFEMESLVLDVLLSQEKHVTHTTRQEQHHTQATTRTNPPTPHSTTLKGGTTTVRTTCLVVFSRRETGRVGVGFTVGGSSREGSEKEEKNRLH